MKLKEPKFTELKSRNEGALIAYICAGDPTPEATTEIVHALVLGGADIIELGLPFSDPIADGPTIQASIERALYSGMNPDIFFDLARLLDADVAANVPLVVMTFDEITEILSGVSLSHIVAVVAIIGGIIGIVRYLEEKFHKKDEIRDSFPFKAIRPEELQDNLAMTVAGLRYVERPESIIGASESKIGTLITGKPNAGKTQEALEVVRGIRRDVTVLIPESKASIGSFKVPHDIRGDVVLFFDDLPNYYARPKEFHESFERAIKILDGACNSVHVVVTARTTKLDRLYEYPGKFWDGFDKIELVEFENEDTYNLIDELCRHFGMEIGADAKEKIVRENDRTPKNIAFFFKELDKKDIKHISIEEVRDFKSTVKESWDSVYNKLGEDERSVFKALDVIYESGVIPHRKFVSRLARNIHRPKDIFGGRRIEKSIGILIGKHLIEEKESLILCDDIYREGRGDVEGNIKNVIKILFKASKDRDLKFLVDLSLKGFADVLSGREKFVEDQIGIIRKIIELNPDLAAAHSNLGVLLNNLERYDEAEEEYREATGADPDYAAAHYNLGNLLNNLKRYDEAEEEYREAIRADPNLAAAHYNLGFLLNNLKRYDEAEEEYREAIRADPDYAEAHSNLGNLLKNLKRYDEAEEEYREAIRADPDYAAAHSNLGVLLKNLKRYDEAEEEYIEAIRIDPDLAEAYVNLGTLLLGTERPEEAKKEFEIAKELFENQGREADVKKMAELLADT
ncbi:MAG: tetratricopeptide repeat protein [Candidatus Methanospirareceae archaeon]